MGEDELMFNKYKKYVSEWAERAIRGDRVISFEEWRKRKSTEVRNSFIEMVKDTRASFVSYQFDVKKLSDGMGYIDEDYKTPYLIMKVELLGAWQASSKVYFDLYVEQYHVASWAYDTATKKVEKKDGDEHDFMEFLMNPEVCSLFVGKTGVVKLI